VDNDANVSDGSKIVIVPLCGSIYTEDVARLLCFCYRKSGGWSSSTVCAPTSFTGIIQRPGDTNDAYFLFTVRGLASLSKIYKHTTLYVVSISIPPHNRHWRSNHRTSSRPKFRAFTPTRQRRPIRLSWALCAPSQLDCLRRSGVPLSRRYCGRVTKPTREESESGTAHNNNLLGPDRRRVKTLGSTTALWLLLRTVF
jgi:hypothetical protein